METRTLKIIIAGILIVFAAYIYFYPPTGTQPNPTPPDGSTNDTLVLQDTIHQCMDFSKYNPSTLKTGLIADMVSVYRNNQLSAINSKVSDDAHSVWFHLDSIKKFIYHIEKLSAKNKTNSDKLGLRFYYAAYPDTAKWSYDSHSDLKDFLKDPEKIKYEKKHTIVMIPTIENSTGGNMDFNPADVKTYTLGIDNPIKKKDGQINSADEATLQKPVMALTGSSAGSSIIDKTAAKNHGSLIPPGSTSVEGF